MVRLEIFFLLMPLNQAARYLYATVVYERFNFLRHL